MVISAHPIPGNEWAVGRVVDGLARKGAEVVHTGVEPVHVSGHARQGELKTLLSVARPEWFVPVHGEYRHLVNHAVLADAMGVETHKVLVCEDGDVLALERRRVSSSPARSRRATSTWTARSATSVTGSCEIAGCSQKRVSWSSSAPSTSMHGTWLADPEIVTRGWVHAPEAEELIEEASAAVRAALESALADGAPDHEALVTPRPQGARQVRRRTHQAEADDRAGGGLRIEIGVTGIDRGGC